jgi:hypothetical protein
MVSEALPSHVAAQVALPGTRPERLPKIGEGFDLVTVAPDRSLLASAARKVIAEARKGLENRNSTDLLAPLCGTADTDKRKRCYARVLIRLFRMLGKASGLQRGDSLLLSRNWAWLAIASSSTEAKHMRGACRQAR